jgi:hypothetical protein
LPRHPLVLDGPAFARVKIPHDKLKSCLNKTIGKKSLLEGESQVCLCNRVGCGILEDVNSTGWRFIVNKKDIGAFKRQLKEDGEVSITQLCRIFSMGDSKEIIFREASLFSMCDEAEQSLYLDNYKKMLTGALDSKVFEFPFKSQIDGGAPAQGVLFELLTDDSIAGFEDRAASLVEKIHGYCDYEGDIVANFVKAEYSKPFKKKAGPGEDDFEGADDTVYKMKFILCSINKIVNSDKSVRFDYRDRQFSVHHDLNAVVNLNAPIEGFMFPSISEDAVDVNHLIYSTSKSDQVNLGLIEQVLDCVCTMTAKEEKGCFDGIIKTMVGERSTPEVIKNIYETIDHLMENENEEEDVTVELEVLEKVLFENGIDTSRFKEVASEIAGEASRFKPANVLPGYRKKSLKITTEIADIAISPENLDKIRQVVDGRGRKCVLIEVDEDVEINGIRMVAEKL